MEGKKQTQKVTKDMDSYTMEEIIQFAKSKGMPKEAFEDAVADIYAGMVDMRLDTDPESVHEHIAIFGGHKLVITCHREFLN